MNIKKWLFPNEKTQAEKSSAFLQSQRNSLANRKSAFHSSSGLVI